MALIGFTHWICSDCNTYLPVFEGQDPHYWDCPTPGKANHQRQNPHTCNAPCGTRTSRRHHKENTK